ncbi:diguanylate cyclase [Streptomyces aureus]|uniref:diguanylate cyclase n=1 Tax=Streptomyces aureus TaxID=193461 RepID=UPI003159577B
MRPHRASTPTRWRRWRSRPPLRIPYGADDVGNASRPFRLNGVLLLWLVPAVADWVMHCRSDIEHTSGVRESAVHALMMTEAGIPVVAGLTAKINPLVLSLMGSAALAHGATVLWEVSLATHKREVRPVEQHIHSFLEVLPVTAAAFTACLHRDQVRRAFRSGGRPTGSWCPRTGRCRPVTSRRSPRESASASPCRTPRRWLAASGPAATSTRTRPYMRERWQGSRGEERRAGCVLGGARLREGPLKGGMRR